MQRISVVLYLGSSKKAQRKLRKLEWAAALADEA
jgi:hypothetical protein